MQPSVGSTEQGGAGLPAIPDGVRDAAREAPDHWFGMVDPAWTGEGPPPGWAVIGEWRSGVSGEIEEYRANDDYRPSPQMLGWPEPADPVDAAVQAAVTGYGQVDEAVAALAVAEVTVLRAPEGGAVVVAGDSGQPVVPVFTSPTRQPLRGTAAHEDVSAVELARRLAGSGVALAVNPASEARLVVDADAVLDAHRNATAPNGHPRQDDEVATRLSRRPVESYAEERTL